MTKRLKEGDRVVIKSSEGDVMGYFLGYYNHDYAVVTPDDQQDGGNLITARRRVSRAPADPANVQVFEASK